METGFRDRIEAGFESWGHTVFAHAKPIVAAALLFVAACAAGLPRLYLDVSFEAFLGQGDSVLVSYEAFRERFGRDERIILAIDAGPASGSSGVFTAAFLERLRDLHDALEDRLPHVTEVTSLVNARDTRGEDDTLLVEDFLEPWPEDEEALSERRIRALANPLFRNTTISADGQIAAILIELDLYSSTAREESTLGGFDEDPGDAEGDRGPPTQLTGAETDEVVSGIRQIILEFEREGFEIHLGGSSVMLSTVGGSMLRDMPRFVALAIGSIGFLLFLLFRRAVGVVTPLVVVALTVASTFGLMGWSGTPMHVPTQVLPTFILAVGVGDAVHLLTIFFERLRAGDDREQALAHALGHSGLALVLTSITTAAGLASFASAGIAPISAVGTFAPIGVMIALGLSLTLLPALLSIVPLGQTKDDPETRGENAVDRLLAGFGRFATHRPKLVLVVALGLAIVAGLGASRLVLSHDPLAWLDSTHKIVRDTRFIDEALGGTVSFEVLVEAEAGAIRSPQTLEAMAALGESFETQARDGYVAGQSISLADVVKEINRALNADDPGAYAIPKNDPLVAQELLLFENTGTDDLEDLTDSQYEVGRITVRMPWDDAVQYTSFFDEATRDAEAALGGHGAVSMTGVLALLVRAITALVTSLARSYAIAFAVITPMMILLLGNLRTGLLAMIPNTLPILMTLGLMGFAGLPLDAFSLMIGGIALGLAVDDTIHFMHNYRRYRRHGMDLEAAVHSTLQTAGRAMLITTIVLSTGFAGFVMSSMTNLMSMGILVGFAISTAFFADVLLAPALLAIADHEEYGD